MWAAGGDSTRAIASVKLIAHLLRLQANKLQEAPAELLRSQETSRAFQVYGK